MAQRLRLQLTLGRRTLWAAGSQVQWNGGPIPPVGEPLPSLASGESQVGRLRRAPEMSSSLNDAPSHSSSPSPRHLKAKQSRLQSPSHCDCSVGVCAGYTDACITECRAADSLHWAVHLQDEENSTWVGALLQQALRLQIAGTARKS